MEQQQVSCDACHESFEMNLKERKHPGNIIEAYIQCPHCKAEYISFVTDEYARREQQEVMKLREKHIKRQGKLSMHMENLKSKLIEQRKASE